MSEALVLVPGMMSDARVFEHQLRHLGRDRVVTVAPITLGERIEQIASDLLMRLPQRFALAGAGLGGAVAMEIVRRAPGRVARLCLIAADPLADTPQMASAREPLIVAARAGRLEDALRLHMRPEYLAAGAGRPEVLEQYFAMGQDLGPEIFVRQSRVMQKRPDYQGALRKFAVPVLVICGAQDGRIPVRRHEFTAELIPDAVLEVIEEAGHLPLMEQPKAVTGLLREWLEAPLVLR